MLEEKIRFFSGGLQIEGLSYMQDGENGAVITHPHPLYGGNMHNAIVKAVSEVYQEKGFSTLRFNFRGVGASDGTYTDGEGECKDVKSAIDYMHKKGRVNIDLVGYSFGAWVNMKTTDIDFKHLRTVMISPPVSFLDFSLISHNQKIDVIITGQMDDIAPPYKIKDLILSWNPNAHFFIIKGADHFYSFKTEELKHVLTQLTQ